MNQKSFTCSELCDKLLLFYFIFLHEAIISVDCLFGHTEYSLNKLQYWVQVLHEPLYYSIHIFGEMVWSHTIIHLTMMFWKWQIGSEPMEFWHSTHSYYPFLNGSLCLCSKCEMPKYFGTLWKKINFSFNLFHSLSHFISWFCLSAIQIDWHFTWNARWNCMK